MENKEKRIERLELELNDKFSDLKVLEKNMNKAREYSANCEEFDEDSFETEEAQDDYNFACYAYWDLQDSIAKSLQELKDLDENAYKNYKDRQKESKYCFEFDTYNCGRGSSELNCLLCDKEYDCPYNNKNVYNE